MIHKKNRQIIIVSILTFFCLVFVMFFQRIQAEEGIALLEIFPVTSTINVAEFATVTVQLSDIAEVYGVEIELSFDPSIIQVIDANPEIEGVQISSGDCPVPDFEIVNNTENITGTISYAVVQLNPTPPCNGGNVATIVFEGLAYGTSNVSINSSLISSADGISITHTIQDGIITVSSVTSTPSSTLPPTPSVTNTPMPTNQSPNIFLPLIFNPTLPPTITPTPTITLTPTPTKTPTITPTPTPISTGVISIIFIYYDGQGSQEPDEYVEIRNDDTHSIQLQNWTLEDASAHIFTFPNFVMIPGQVCRVYTNENHPEWCGFNFESLSAIWNNTGDTASLRNNNNDLIDTYSYP